MRSQAAFRDSSRAARVRNPTETSRSRASREGLLRWAWRKLQPSSEWRKGSDHHKLREDLQKGCASEIWRRASRENSMNRRALSVLALATIILWAAGMPPAAQQEQQPPSE